MDPALLAVATSGANALVSLMTTDLWERAKAGVTATYSRFSKSTETIDHELEESRADLTSSSERGDLSDTTIELQQIWKGKFRRLLAEHSDAADDLRAILAMWQEVSGDTEPKQGGVIHQTATAHDSSRIYQQGSGNQFNG